MKDFSEEERGLYMYFLVNFMFLGGKKNIKVLS